MTDAVQETVQNIMSASACANICESTPGCASFGFRKASQQCDLLNGTPEIVNNNVRCDVISEEDGTYSPTACALTDRLNVTGRIETASNSRDNHTFTYDGDWLIIMRRYNDDVNFNQSWTSYKHGFGDPTNQFWIGNKVIYQLTNQNNYSLQMDLLSCNGRYYYARWSLFRIGSEYQNYKVKDMLVESFNTTNTTKAVESLTNPLGASFSTYDRARNTNCPISFGGGWWFRQCAMVCLTCTYSRCQDSTIFPEDMRRLSMKFASVTGNNCDYGCLLKAATMKIRRNA
ncbi:ryncolin-4-like [Lingula anatina]|uniref:Ryncolin-4-like n=1 Tax=Lingula anatina TaxID=7574 RepID=A0A1S3K221_LINAN|nr:ryncolin-4-like [Lingula anatina]|eukprot:XP_013416444.1 ryncolin-4-like [Lingula anatina]